MFGKFFKNLNIEKKILVVFLGLLIFSQAFVSILSYFSIKGIGDYSIGEMSNLSSSASEIGRSSLKSQSESYLKSVSSSISKSTEAMLGEISDQVVASCVGVEKIYKSGSNFKGFLPLLPELTPKPAKDTASSKAYVIDPSSDSSAPLVYDTPEYNSGEIFRVDVSSWQGTSAEERGKIAEEKTVVSKNSIPKNLRDQFIMLSNCEYIFQPIYESSNCISSIYLGTENGIFYKYSEDNSRERYDPRTRPWYKSALNSENGAAIWQNTYISKTTGRFCITCSKAFKDSSGKILGVCAVDMYIDDISDLVTKSKIGESGYNFIVDSSGNIVMHPDYINIFKNENSVQATDLSRSGLIQKVVSEESGVSTVEIDGKNYYAAYAPMVVSDWRWVSIASEDEIMKPISEIENLISESSKRSEKAIKNDFAFIIIRFFIIIAISFLAIYLICVKLARSLSRPVVRLSKFAKVVGQGEFDLNIPVESSDEIGQLSNSFNTMTADLKKYMNDLKVTTAEKEKIHSELMIANKIQKSMLPYIFPAFPDRTDLDIYAIMDPAREIGGDFYDFFFIGKNKLAMLIADVSGKGVSAALFMVIAKILIKNQLQNGDSPEKVFEVVNNRLCENNEAGMFVTCFMGVLDIKTGELTYANAGHNPPMIYSKKEKTCTPIAKPHGFVLGGIKDLKYTQSKTYLYPGDFLFLYTDGVTEAENEEGKLFSQAKLEQIIKSCGDKDLKIQDLIVHIRGEIDKFAGKAERSDDITMLAFKNFTIVPFDPKDKNRGELHK